MRVVVALVIGICLMTTTVLAAPADKLTDLPKSHWAYEAVSLLAKEGIIDGYSDKTFKGDKEMTRYEMAQVVAKAMANQAKANIALRALIDKLAVEFALDMNKINARLDKVEKEQAKIKFSGEMAQQYKSKKDAAGTRSNYGQQSMSINIEAKVDSNSTLHARFADPAPSRNMFKKSSHYKFGDGAPGGTGRLFDRMYGQTKVGALDLKVGRQALDTDPENIIVDSDFYSFDGISLGTKFNDFDFSYSRGRFARGLNQKKNDDLGIKVAVYDFNGLDKANFANVDVQTLSLGTKLGKLGLNASWVEFERSEDGKPNLTLMAYDVYQADWKFNDQFLVGFEYGKNTKAISGGGAFTSWKAVFGPAKLKRAGQQNFTITSSSFDNNAIYFAYSTIDCPDEKDGSINKITDRFTNIDYAYKLALSKNLSIKLEYADIKDKDQSAQSYSFWKLATKWVF